jgi:hypothetical protein
MNFPCVVLRVLSWFPFVLVSPSRGFTGSPGTGPEEISCRLVLSTSASVEDRWTHTAAEERPTVTETSEVVRGQVFTAYVFFTHYARDGKGEAGLRYDIRILKPDGSSYYEQKDVVGHTGRAGDGKDVLLARDLIHVSFDPPDPLGKYTVTILAHDEIDHTTASETRTIQLVEDVPGESFSSAEDVGKWITGYFESPHPERAIAALTTLELLTAKEKTKEDDHDESDSTGAQSFFHEVFESNPWLYPRLIAGYAKYEPAGRKAALEVLSRATFDTKALVASFDEKDSRAWKALAEQPRRNLLTDPITDPSHLDALWGQFLATGKFAPIYRLCEALAPEETGAVPDKAYAPKKDEPEASLRLLIHEMAEWSIASNAEQHPLVKSYCEWILSQEKIPKAVRAELKKALDS